MLEKLATHEVKDISELFNLADKCARAAEGCAWHSQPAPVAGKAGNPEADATAQSSGRNKNRKQKKSNNNKALVGAPTAAALTTVASGGRDPRGDKRRGRDGVPECQEGDQGRLRPL
jgi:hypothetical protein